jgi:anti-anti-sigma regulatory factor
MQKLPPESSTQNICVPDPEIEGFDFSSYCRDICATAPLLGDMFLDLRQIKFLSASNILAVLKMRTHFSGRSQGFYLLNPSTAVVSILHNARLDKTFHTVDIGQLAPLIPGVSQVSGTSQQTAPRNDEFQHPRAETQEMQSDPTLIESQIASIISVKPDDVFSLEVAKESHFNWTDRFSDAISNRQTVDVKEIKRDDCCELGRWLKVEGKTLYGPLREFTDLDRVHTRFHSVAGVVATVVNSGRSELAKSMLESSSSNFGRCSHEVVTAIDSLMTAAAFFGTVDRRLTPR